MGERADAGGDPLLVNVDPQLEAEAAGLGVSESDHLPEFPRGVDVQQRERRWRGWLSAADREKIFFRNVARVYGRLPRASQRPDRDRNHPMCKPPLLAEIGSGGEAGILAGQPGHDEAISSGVPRRLTGMVATIFSSTSGLIARTMSVPM